MNHEELAGNDEERLGENFVRGGKEWERKHTKKTQFRKQEVQLSSHKLCKD